MVVSYTGIAGKRGKNPTKIVIHNDGGSQNAKASFYKSWLENHNPELGFAHYYVASDGIYQAEYDANSAWHCANSTGNRDYLGIEVCQSLGNEATFKENEQKAFKLAADLCKKYKLNPAVSIFPLHRELSSTDCPHRSFALHGKANAAVKAYYVEQVKKYYSGSAKKVKEYYKEPGRYEMKKDDKVYLDTAFKRPGGSWNFKKGQKFYAEKIVMHGKTPRLATRLGGTWYYVTANKDYVKKV